MLFLTFRRYFSDCQLDNLFADLYIFSQTADDDLSRDSLLFLPPAIVVGHAATTGIANFGLAGKLGFGENGHTDNLRTPGLIETGLGSS